MEENQKKALQEMVCNFDESMKNAMDTLKEIFKIIDPIIKTEKVKMVKKRVPKKVKTNVVKELSDLITLNANAPIADHHSGDQGVGKIEFVKLE